MLPLLLPAVLGCGSSDDDTLPDEGPDPPAVDDSGASRDTSAPGPEWFEPDAFTIYAMFAVDDDGQLHGYVVDGVERAPWVSLDFADSQNNRCTVIFEIDPTQAPLVAWSFEDETPEADGQLMNHTAFLVPEGAPAVTVGCELWDVDRYGEVIDLVASQEWGVGIGDLRIDVEEEVRDSDGWLEDLLDAGQLAGASWQSTVFEPTTWASHTSFAAEAPADFSVTFDADGLPENLMDAGDYVGGGDRLPRGVYILQPIYLWDFQTYFE